MKKILLNSLLIFILSSFLVNAAGLGVAPATLNFENALKGAITEKQLNIQNPGEESIIASIEIEGELKEWIELSSYKLEIPRKSSKNIIVKLNPSETGTYSGKFKVRAETSSDMEGSGMGLLPGVDTNIVATVTDQAIVRGEITKILTKDEAYGNKVKFIVGFTNKGNVPIGPSIKIDIEKRGTGIIDTIEKDLTPIKPGEDIDYEVEVETKDKETDVYYRGNVIISLKYAAKSISLISIF